MQDSTALAPSPHRAALYLQSWAEREQTPRAIVDERLKLVWINRAARKLLDGRKDIEIREGVLAARSARNHQALLTFIESTGSSLNSFCFPSEDGDGHVLFRAVEVQRDDDTRYLGLVFYRSGSEFKARYADLDKVFNLTGTEHRVLQRLLDGKTADEVASEFRVSIETTRSHIRQIYAKADVTSREGLFSRTRPYRVT
jgi:DNA-binding CsgD family transcriptional regulator